MQIKVNDKYKFKVTQEDLTVKDKKLYNTHTKIFEGIDGDIVEFIYEEDGRKVLICGSVDGYTHFGTVKIHGREEVYKTDPYTVKIEHLSIAEEI